MSFAEYTLADVNGTFASDEIVPVYGTWKATVSSANGANHAINFFGMKDLGDLSYNWHTAYTVINGDEVVFENNTVGGEHSLFFVYFRHLYTFVYEI